MMAQACGYQPGDFIHAGDAHIYTNHMEQIELQLSRNQRHFPRSKSIQIEQIF